MLKKLNGIRLVRFEPEFHAAKLYEWYYSEDYHEFFREYPQCPSATELAQQAIGRAFIIVKDVGNERGQESFPIGMITHMNVNEVSRSFEVGVLVEREHQKHEHAITALKIMLNWMFNSCNFYKAKLKIIAKNKRICDILEKFGAFREGGANAVSKKDVFFNGTFHDVATYAMFKTDFKELYLTDFEPRLEPHHEILKRSA